jgi:hypothetical protein
VTESELAQTLAEYQGKAYVIAPAGFGKTYLIALAVKFASEPQLILTHTFAGVNAIKNKMRILGIPSSNYRIDTIAAWSLRLCLAYPKNSVWNVDRPQGKQWTQLYTSCASLLSKGFAKRIVRASYSGVYVDEYQDCTTAQHNVVCALAELLPCRLLGDPMQAIFDFDDDPVDWRDQVFPNFACLGELETPWRWRNAGTDDIGIWLTEVRRRLEKGLKINLSDKLPMNVSFKPIDLDDFSNKNRLRSFYEIANKYSGENIAVIYPGAPIFKNKTHQLARALAGQYSSIEEVEGTKLFSFIQQISKAKTPDARLKYVVEFAKKCMTGINPALSAGTKRGEIAKITKATKHPQLVQAANNYYNNSSAANLKQLLLLLRDNPYTRTFRSDLLNRILNVLDIHIQSQEITIHEAAERFQIIFRHAGRPIRRTRIIGTTLLLKGLEFDHAIILYPTSLTTKELYVALTRGSKSITIISAESALPVY